MSSITHNDRTMTPQREAERIYTALFREPVPEVIADRFAYASLRLEEHAGPEELRAYRHALRHVADLEALEFAGRFTKRPGILSRKFQLMVCLAETLPQNRACFIKDRDARLPAYAALASGALRTAGKLIKGLWLLRGVRGA